MARKKAKSPKQSMRLLSRKLWQIIPPKEWFALLQEIAPDNKWSMPSHTTISGCCPYHDDKTPSFRLNFTRGIGKCFGTCEKLVVDIVQMIAKLRHSSVEETLLFLSQRFNLQEKFGESLDGLGEFHRLQEMKKALAIAMNEILSEIIRDKPAHLEYCMPAFVYLTEVRHLDLDLLPGLPLGIYAKPAHLKKYIPDENMHEMVDSYLEKYQESDLWGSVCFHYNDSPNTISRFKLLPLNTILINEVGGPAKVTAKLGKDIVIKEKSRWVKDPMTQDQGLFGIHKYRRMIGSNRTEMYVTEGEFDVLQTMAAQDRLGYQDFMIFGTSGTGSMDMSFMRGYGIKHILLIQDHPSKNGDGWARAVLRQEKNFTRSGTLQPLDCKVFNWPIEIKGSDLDEAVLMMGYEQLREYFVAHTNRYFLNSTAWVISRCTAESNAIKEQYANKISELDKNEEHYPIEKSNLENEEIGKLRDKVSTWLQYVHSPEVKAKFLAEIGTQFEFNAEELAKLSENKHDLTTVEGTAAYLMEHLSPYMEFAYYELTSKALSYTAWSKIKSEVIPVHQATPTQVVNVLTTITGENFSELAEKFLGNNEVYLSDTEGLSAARLYKQKQQNLMVILDHGLNIWRGRAKNRADLLAFAQGVHFIDLPKEQRQHNQIYFVNGKHIFRGTYTSQDEVEWEEWKSVTDDRLLFTNLSQRTEWSQVVDVAGLDAANGLDLREIFEKVVYILNGWTFEDHDITVKYLAGWLMSLTTMRATGPVNITMVSGESTSGKSSFSSGLLGGTNHDGVAKLVESTVYNFNTSNAGFYHEMHGCSLLWIMDEAEQSESHSTSVDKQVSNIARTMYMIPHGGSRVKRSNTNKQVEEFVLRMPILLAGIHVPSDETFQSRTMRVRTIRQDGHKPPADHISERFSKEDMEVLSRQLTVCLLPYIPTMITRMQKMKEELKDHIKSTITISDRLVDSILSSMVVLEMVGEDPKEIAYEMVSRHKARYTEMYGKKQQSREIDTCLYHPCVPVVIDDNIRTMVPASKLMMESEYELLNNSAVGVYYLEGYEDKTYIVFFWRQLIYGALQRTRFSSLTERTLKERADKTPFSVEKIDEPLLNYIRHQLDLHDIRSEADISVIESDYLIIMDNLDDANAGLKINKEETEKLIKSKKSKIKGGVKESSLVEDIEINGVALEEDPGTRRIADAFLCDDDDEDDMSI